MAKISKDDISKTIDEIINSLDDPQDVITMVNALILILKKLKVVLEK